MTKQSWSILAIMAVILIGGFAYANRSDIRDVWYRVNQPALPEEEMYQPPTEEVTITEPTHFEGPEVTDLSVKQDEVMMPEKLLAVPFTSQAPHANWDYPYQEACEEASVLMVAAYYNGESGVINKDEADRRILDLVEFETEAYGFYEDTTAEETVQLIHDYYPNLQAEVVPMTGPESVKAYVSQGIPVILPADGKALPNPNFRNGGPLYHMLVVRGYTDDRFITNDPGTRLGEKFLYSYDGLLNAVHDWNNGDVPNGERVMIVITPRGDGE